MSNAFSLEELENRMRPGGWSPEGYLTKEQSLSGVMTADHTFLKSAGITPKEIAGSIEEILESGKNGDRFFPKKVGHFKVRIIRSRKMRTCPWAPKEFERCTIGKGTMFLTTEDFEIKNTKLDESLSGTTLSVHMIYDHDFFGGPGTEYRIDPAKAIRVLELTRNIMKE